jgi:hypothetical protein
MKFNKFLHLNMNAIDPGLGGFGAGPGPGESGGPATADPNAGGSGPTTSAAKFRESGGRFFDISTGAEVPRESAVGHLIQTDNAGIVKLTGLHTSIDPATGRVVSGEGAQTEAEFKGGERRKRIEGDLRAGLDLGKEIIGEGSLGRQQRAGTVAEGLDRLTGDVTVAEDLGRIQSSIRQGRSADVQDILARRRANLQGLGREEVQAERARAGQEISRQAEQQRRALAAIQARTGVRGGTAAAQQMQAVTAGARTRAEFERDLFLRNEQIKREALSQFEQSVGAAERGEFERQVAGAELERFNLSQQLQERQLQIGNIQRTQAQSEFNIAQQFRERQIEQANQQALIEQERFNLEQAAREKFGQQAVSLGFAQLASAELTAEQAAQAQASAAQASSGCFHPETLIAMKDGKQKRIQDIHLGDETKYGVVYSLLVTQSPLYDMYSYEGVTVAGSHAVKENGQWVRVREAVNAIPSTYRGMLYNLGVKNHQLSANKILFSDIDELDLVSEIDELYLDGLNGIA